MPKHHYNPNFILRNFVDANRTLWVLDKQTARCWAKRGGNGRYDAFAENGYNTIKDVQGSPDDSVEDFYTEVEACAAPIIDRLIVTIEAGLCPHIGELDKEHLARFLWAQYVRSPFERAATRRDGTASRAMYQAILDTSLEKGIPPDLIYAVLPKNLEQMIDDAIVKAPTAPEEHDGAVAYMRRMAVDFLRIPPTVDALFVTSDRPCLFEPILQPGGNVFLPLASNVAIRLSRPEDASPTPIGVSRSTARRINRSIFSAALRYVAGPSRQHLCELLAGSRGSPGTTSTDTPQPSPEVR